MATSERMGGQIDTSASLRYRKGIRLLADIQTLKRKSKPVNRRSSAPMSNLPFSVFAKLCDMLKELYGLSSVADFRATGGGFTTENFLCSDGTNTYFLKRYHTPDMSRLHDIMAAYACFSRGGIPIITPIRNAQGDDCFFLDESWWSVFPFVAGIKKRGEELTERDVQKLGGLLAAIHRVGMDCPPADIQPIALWNKNVFLSEKHALEYAYTHLASKQDVDEMAFENVQIQDRFLRDHHDYLSDISLINHSLIHGDFTHNNVFFKPDGEILATFDLDKTCLAPRGYEVARSVFITCFDHAWDASSFRLAHAFLRAYLAAYPMNFAEFHDGLHAYVSHFMHMTWLEKKILVDRSKQHAALMRSSTVRVKHLSEEFLTLAERLYPFDDATQSVSRPSGT